MSLNLKNKKALFIGVNRSYTNPTAELNILILGQIFDLSFYGPGFVSDKVLKMGINSWLQLNENFDIIFTDSYVFEQENIISRSKPFLGDFIRFEPVDYFKNAQSLQNLFLNYKGKKVFIANFDTYGISDDMIQRLVDSDSLVIDGGISTNRLKSEVEEVYKSKCYGNDNWFSFVNTFKSRIISVPHFISMTEFDFQPLDNRKYLFNVIGAPYQERKKAFELLTPTQKIVKKINYYRSSINSRRITKLSFSDLTELRIKYLSEISQTKFCYCSGGPWLSPVRKYFEIPARGAVAIGWPCNGFENLGFVDGVNFISAINNKMIKEVISDFNIEDIQAIATNGRSLIWEKHSDWARAIQLSESFQLILNNKFHGSYWENGSYKHF